MITATFPPPGQNVEADCLKGREEKAGCSKSFCLVLTNPPQFQRWGWKRKIQILVQQLSYTAVLVSGNNEPGNPSLVSASSVHGLWAAFVPFGQSCLAKDRLSSQVEIQRQINFSPAPGTLNIALHQPGSETVGFFQQTWYQRTALAGLNKWVWKSPLCYYEHTTQYFTSCLKKWKMKVRWCRV